jgi:hypothetical protein
MRLSIWGLLWVGLDFTVPRMAPTGYRLNTLFLRLS